MRFRTKTHWSRWGKTRAIYTIRAIIKMPGLKHAVNPIRWFPLKVYLALWNLFRVEFKGYIYKKGLSKFNAPNTESLNSANRELYSRVEGKCCLGL